MENYDTVLISCTSSEGMNLPIDLGSYYRLPLQQNVNDILSFRVKDVSIPLTFYTIKTGDLVFGLQGNVTGSQSIAIPAGNYTDLALATFIQDAWLTLTGTTITVSFAGAALKTVVTRTAGADATIAITATELALAGMGPILGFYSAIPAATTLTASNTFHITGPNKLIVQSQALNTGRNMNSINLSGTIKAGTINLSNIIFAIWVTGNEGGIVNNIIPSDWYQFGVPQKLTALDFMLTDENGTEIQLNGYPWSITIELRQKKNA